MLLLGLRNVRGVGMKNLFSADTSNAKTVDTKSILKRRGWTTSERKAVVGVLLFTLLIFAMIVMYGLIDSTTIRFVVFYIPLAIYSSKQITENLMGEKL